MGYEMKLIVDILEERQVSIHEKFVKKNELNDDNYGGFLSGYSNYCKCCFKGESDDRRKGRFI
ncbi:hypothetical protein D3C73_984370 [compost metagenome]